ncbi:TniQ family protein [Pseudomonas putida]
MKVLVEWLEAETLFSLCSRQHLISECQQSSKTRYAFFGRNFIRSFGEYSTGLNMFAESTSFNFGHSLSILYEHTTLPFFLSIQSDSYTFAAIQESLNVAASAKMAGFLSGINSLQHWRVPQLKGCAQCILDDNGKFGVSYWHLPHQIPGVWACSRHNRPQPLCALAADSSNLFSATWVLPNDCPLNCRPMANVILDEQICSFFKICEDYFVFSQRGGVIESENAKRRVWLRALEMGFNLHREQGLLRAAASYKKNLAPLQAIPELFSIFVGISKGNPLATWFLEESSSPRNPLLFLSIVFWGFGTWRAFDESGL